MVKVTLDNNITKFDGIISKSVLSVQMQELLGTYLLFERYEKHNTT